MSEERVIHTGISKLLVTLRTLKHFLVKKPDEIYKNNSARKRSIRIESADELRRFRNPKLG